MNPQHLINGCEGFSSGDHKSFLIPSLPVPSSLLVGSQSPVSFQVLTPSMFQAQENRGITERTNNEAERDLGLDSKSLSLKLGDEVEAPKGSGSGKIGYTKLCSRGHWRPAEDAQLKELVAQLGPQNWNLIAEHLPGRSGII